MIDTKKLKLKSVRSLNTRKLYYVASPYSGSEHLSITQRAAIEYSRFFKVTLVAGYLIEYLGLNGLILPITTSRTLKEISPDLGTSWNYWKKADTILLKHADALIVVTIPGWDESVGVGAEIKIAKKLKMPIYFIDPLTLSISSLEV